MTDQQKKERNRSIKTLSAFIVGTITLITLVVWGYNKYLDPQSRDRFVIL